MLHNSIRRNRGIASRIRAAAWPIAGLLAVLLVAGSFSRPAASQAGPPESVPLKASELLQLLRDPDVRLWLEQRKSGANEKVLQAGLTEAGSTVSALLDARSVIIRAHLASVAAALPTLLSDLWNAARIPVQDAEKPSLTLLCISVVLAAGIGVEWPFRRATAGALRRLAPLRPTHSLQPDQKVFDANGIKFASPTVQVSREAAAPSAAAARQALTLQLAGSDAR